MSEDHSEFVQGQISALENICALLARRLFTSDGARKDFAIFLGHFDDEAWEGRHLRFLEGATNAMNEVALLVSAKEGGKTGRYSLKMLTRLSPRV